MSKSSAWIGVFRFFGLWFALSVFFSLVNNSLISFDILIQSINALLFTTGFYFSYNFLIKPFLYNGKTSKFVVFYLLLIAISSVISMLSTYEIYVLQGKKFYVENYWKEPVFFSSNYILMLLTISTLLGFRILIDKRQTQTLLETVEKEKISNELSFLKAQINPHFLFNSLNNILFQIDKSNTEARETLLKFSEMLRYQLYECSTESIGIEKEIQYIKNYIGIQMLRKSDKYDCQLTVSDNVKNFSIAPLILIPFIENSFKHVSNHATRKNYIAINMDYKDGRFLFSSINDKDNIAALEINENKGIGLANVKRRLDLLYEDKYKLNIHDDQNRFGVDLELKVS